jgi:hypothetical protein
MCSVLHLPDADITSRLFAFLDIDGDGRINFREYITGTFTHCHVVTGTRTRVWEGRC